MKRITLIAAALVHAVSSVAGAQPRQTAPDIDARSEVPRLAWDPKDPFTYPRYVLPEPMAEGMFEDPDPTLGGLQPGHIRSLSPRVLLPDGTEFKTWDDGTKYTRVYHVAAGHPKASDRNPGTVELPFKSINHAAQILQPGEKVVVHAGIYREWVSPARGGTGPDRMIAYEAAPGEKVVLKGSEAYTGPFSREMVLKYEGATPGSPPKYTVKLPRQWFIGYMPYGMQNEGLRVFYRYSYSDDTIAFDWREKLRLRRGLVFQDGRRLKQVRRIPDLLKEAGTFWCENDGLTIHIRPFGDVAPEKSQWEFTTRETIFAPEERGRDFIRVKGFVMEHAANAIPLEYIGALSTNWGSHWIVEDNTIRHANATGIDVGSRFWHIIDRQNQGYHIIRRNTVDDCGIVGISGIAHPLQQILVEDNSLRGNGWHDFERNYNGGAMKFYFLQNGLIRRNLMRDTIGGPGVYMDLENTNCRLTRNTILNTRSGAGAIFFELGRARNLIDHNIIIGVKKNERTRPGLFTGGHGVFEHDVENLTIAHNLIADTEGAAVHLMLGSPDRVRYGRGSLGFGHKVLNNLFVNCDLQVEFPREQNESNGNVFAGVKPNGAYRIHEPRQLHNFRTWRELARQDLDSVEMAAETKYDWNAMTLTIEIPRELPAVPAQPQSTHDYLDRPREGAKAAPGPLAAPHTGANAIPIDPRKVRP